MAISSTDLPSAAPPPDTVPPAASPQEHAGESTSEDTGGDTGEDARVARQMRRTALDFGAVGIQFGVATAIGYYLGAWLDRLWNTGPWLAMTLALCGVASAFKDLVRLAKRATKQERKP